MSALQPLFKNLTLLPPERLFLAPLALLALFLPWLLILTLIVLKNHLWLRRVFGKTQKGNLKEILQEHIERVGIVQIKLNDLDNLLKELQESSLKHLQKVGVVRFNPFDDTGGDQSFSLALLDAKGNGLVITSLHGREKTRIYAKSVNKGKPGKYAFSDEEEEAVRQAQRA